MKKILSYALLTYLRLCAQLQLKKMGAQVIGITGSAGKSSTMEAVAAILQDKYTIKVGRKANSESGIPLNILGLEPKEFTPQEWLSLALKAPLQLLTNWKKYDWYLIEMGIDSPFPPKNMGYLLKILMPTIGILTTVEAVHSEAFDPVVSEPDPALRKNALITEIAKEKARLINALPENGLAVISADNPFVTTACSPQAPLATFGTQANATVRILEVEYKKESTIFHFQCHKKNCSISFTGYYLPTHFADTCAAALCVAEHIGIPLDEACRAIEKNFLIPPGRATLLKAINGAHILDSSYNSSAQPLLDSLAVLVKIPAQRKLALLGDMRELGSMTKEEHVRVATAATKILDEVVLVGPHMKEYALPVFETAGLIAHWFSTAYQAALYLKANLRTDDILLVKGSQNTLLLEIAIAELLADPTEIETKLCRRGSFWDSQRKQLISQPTIA